jgi:hypothetical protein
MQVESLADSYMQFLYFGLLVIFLLGLRICRFMRVGCRQPAPVAASVHAGWPSPPLHTQRRLAQQPR